MAIVIVAPLNFASCNIYIRSSSVPYTITLSPD
jgi:hypothetical protein